MHPTWRVELVFTEDERGTRADAVLEYADRHLHGWGRAQLNPTDEDVPIIGEEIAAARALIRLGHLLLGEAENEIEDIEHHPVHIHA